MGHKDYQDVTGYIGEWDHWLGKVICRERELQKPLHWRKPRRIFVNSMSDLFHEDVAWKFIDQVFAIMAMCPQHTFQLLTKRSDRAEKYFNDKTYGGIVRSATVETAAMKLSHPADVESFPWLDSNFGGRVIWPLPNVHLGTSCSTQADADWNIPLLMEIPAAFRFVSLEPLLEEIELPRQYLGDERQVDCGGCKDTPVRGQPYCPGHDGGGIDAVIVGCESGPKRRPCKLEWIRSIVDQCREAGVACHVKQIDTTELMPQGVVGNKVSRAPREWPEWARVREY